MRGLTVVADIKPGQDDALRRLLEAIGKDINGNDCMRFPESQLTHFARMAIINDPEIGPRLMFATNYDGDLRTYLDELARISPGLDEVWSKCEDYPGRAGFPAYIRAHAHPSLGLYLGFPQDTVQDIRNYAAIRRQIESFLDLPDVARYLDGPDIDRFLGMLAQASQKLGVLSTLGKGTTTAGRIAGRLGQAGFRAAFLWAAEKYSQWGQSRTFPQVTAECDEDLAERQRTEQAIDTVQLDTVVVQNQMTTYTTIRPERLTELRLALHATQILCDLGWPPGEFADVGTLHSFDWVIVDGGKHMLFLSNFDGSWQNYIGDFVDKLVWGLDALYKHTYDYPPAGMKDTVRFTHWIIDHQIPPQVFYSAYPRQTVLDIRRNRNLSRMLAAGYDGRAGLEWLGLL